MKGLEQIHLTFCATVWFSLRPSCPAQEKCSLLSHPGIPGAGALKRNHLAFSRRAQLTLKGLILWQPCQEWAAGEGRAEP